MRVNRGFSGIREAPNAPDLGNTVQPEAIFASGLHPAGKSPQQVVFSTDLTLPLQPIFVVGISRREIPAE